MDLIKQLAYLVIESSKTDEWQAYATDFMGMQTRRNGERLKIRMDEFSYRFIVQPGASDDLFALGLLVNSPAALKQMEDHLVSHGVEVQHGTPAELADREVQCLIWLRDPEGLRIEIICAPNILTEPVQTPLVPGGFSTGDKGFGHVALCAADLAACESFYRQVLGFKLTDYIVQEIQGIPINFTFMHVNPRHHSVALAGLPSPVRLNHMEVQVQSLDVVGRSMERAKALGINQYMNLGRHPNDRMLSVYLNTPSNFALEIGAEGLEIRDEAAWQVRTYNAISEWGHLD
jgi:2,3-dihydroxybiphenyl 1,2-dioxygenase